MEANSIQSTHGGGHGGMTIRSTAAQIAAGHNWPRWRLGEVIRAHRSAILALIRTEVERRKMAAAKAGAAA